MAKANYPHPIILYDNLGTTFGGARTPKILEWQKGPQSSAYFRTTSDSDREYLRNG